MADVFAEVGKRIVGHQQITDAYLLALAIHHRGRLATMDENIGLLGAAVELIPRM
jgi:predicted nucleic acid-binding protein